MMMTGTFNPVDRRCRAFGALPPPLAGEGWGGGKCAFIIWRAPMPPPCPSPASGGGDAGADRLVLPSVLAQVPA